MKSANMLIGDKHNLKYILGVKLRNFRQEKGYGLKELASITGLSPSYINEIEKGKKYPKAEKIMMLAEGLGVNYDDLVSINMTGRLSQMSELFSSSVLGTFPFHLFGITFENVMELFSAAPKKATALITTLMEISRAYDMNVEQFFLASLRAYQEMHDNYFEETEILAEEFSRKQKWNLNQDQLAAPTVEQLTSVLDELHGVKARVVSFEQYPELTGQRYVFLPGKPSQLLLNDRLQSSQHAYSLALQMGYAEMKIGKKLRTSPRQKFESFDQVMENFKASYFAGALMINRFQVEKELLHIFNSEKWDSSRLLDLFAGHKVTPETFLHRLSQILPGIFGIKELHYLRFEMDLATNKIELTKELNMPRTLVPSGARLKEHHCRRWMPVSLLKDFAEVENQADAPEVLIRAQKAQFMESGDQVLFISIVHKLRLRSGMNRCVSLGLRIDKELESKVKFLNDPEIPMVHVNQTCERCGLADSECSERSAPPSVFQGEQKNEKRNETLMKLAQDFKSKKMNL